jgi:hypothetical protein
VKRSAVERAGGRGAREAAMSSIGNRKALLARNAALALTIALVPGLRSCGEVSFGFPGVIWSTAARPPLQPRPLVALLDLAVVGLAAAGLWALHRTRRSERARALVRGGVQGLAVYQALVILGYAAVYPLARVHTGDDVVTVLIMIYAYTIHPYLAATSWASGVVPASWAQSPLFGDADDIPMRLGYLVMWAIWFGLGALRAAFTRRDGPEAPAG